MTGPWTGVLSAIGTVWVVGAGVGLAVGLIERATRVGGDTLPEDDKDIAQLILLSPVWPVALVVWMARHGARTFRELLRDSRGERRSWDLSCPWCDWTDHTETAWALTRASVRTVSAGQQRKLAEHVREVHPQKSEDRRC